MAKLHKPQRKEQPKHKPEPVHKKPAHQARHDAPVSKERKEQIFSRKQVINTDIDSYITRLRTSEKSEKDHLKFLKKFFAKKPSKEPYMEMENKPLPPEEDEEESMEEQEEKKLSTGAEKPKKVGFFARLFGKKHNAFNEEFEEGYVVEDTTEKREEMEEEKEMFEEEEHEKAAFAPEEAKILKTAHQQNFKKILDKHKKVPKELDKDIEEVIREVEEPQEEEKPKNTLANSLRSWVKTRDQEDATKEKMHSETKLAAPKKEKDVDEIRHEFEDEEKELSEKIQQFERMKKELEELEQRQRERKRF